MTILKKPTEGVFLPRVITSALLTLIVVPSTPAFADVVELEEVVVVAHPLSAGGLAQASTVLSGEKLDEIKGAYQFKVVNFLPYLHTMR